MNATIQTGKPTNHVDLYSDLSIPDITDAHSYILFREAPSGFDPDPVPYRDIEHSWVNPRNRELVELMVANRGGRL